MTSKEIRKHICKPGYWLENVSPLGESPNWQERPMPPDCDVNDSRLFGYEQREFMAMQYKPAKAA